MIEKLACSLGRNDEQPNIDLAIELVEKEDTEGISSIAEGLKNKDKKIANDCIKVLYEIGERNPKLITDYIDDFMNLLYSKNNCLVWGAMTALSLIVPIKASKIAENLDVIVKAYEKGSVIAVDNSISVFAGIAKADIKESEKAFKIIINHLSKCRPKEVGQHSERAFVCITEKNCEVFKRTLEIRMETLTAPQQKRVIKIIKKINDREFL